jgi:hypothetical protein
MLMRIEIFWSVTLFRLVNSNRRFGVAWCLCIQGLLVEEQFASEDGGIDSRDVGFCFYSSK